MTTISIKPSILKTINALVKCKTIGISDYIIRFDKNLMSLKIRDVPNVACLSLSGENTFISDADGIVDLVVATKDIDSILKSAKGDDEIKFTTEPGKNIVVIGNVKKTFPVSVDVKWADRFPNLIMNDFFTLTNEQVLSIVNCMDVKFESDTLILDFTPDKIIFTHRDEPRETILEFKKEELKDVKIVEDGMSGYQAELILALFASIPKGNGVVFNVGHRMPMSMSFDTAAGRATFLIAPFLSN